MGYGLVSTGIQQTFNVDINDSVRKFEQHVDYCNTDFRENILKMVLTKQIYKATDDLNK